MNKYHNILEKILEKGKTQSNKKGSIKYFLNQHINLYPEDLLEIFEGHSIARNKLKKELELFQNGERLTLSDYLDILNLLENRAYFYFTSNKSQLVELATWMPEKGFKRSPLDGVTTEVIQATTKITALNSDIMIFKP